ncbi:DUF1295 domain-containing protein [Aeoliella sp.]|uniref:DUF1295 domain-containing protein n=1 Tax=Aeoliella sp. TaxID=2795800 RepID=UPI003CCC03B3
MSSLLLWNLLTVAFLHTAVWLVSLLKRDVSIVDLFWAVGFAVITCRTALLVQWTPLSGLLVAMVLIWALRLSGYLTWRNWGEPEDHRYGKMREYWGRRFPLVSLFTVFLLQALLTWIVALPVQTSILQGGNLGVFATIGVLLWTIGLVFEAVGDWQLARFKADQANAGKVMDHGLWRYTRHPNYFGEFLVWWGIYVATLEAGFVWWTLIGPVLMSILLLKVSGVTLLEKSLQARKQGYDDYARRTSAFFPWLPKS